MTAVTREEVRRLICARLSRRIGEVAPAGLGTWPDAWDLVAGPSETFLAALEAFLDHDTTETRQRIQSAADELVRAWSRAGKAWHTDGRPLGSRSAPSSGGEGHSAKEMTT